MSTLKSRKVRPANYVVAKKTIRRQQRVAIAIHCYLTQPLRVLLRVLVHVPMFRKRTRTRRHKHEQDDDALVARWFVPLPKVGSGPVAMTVRSHNLGE